MDKTTTTKRKRPPYQQVISKHFVIVKKKKVKKPICVFFGVWVTDWERRRGGRRAQRYIGKREEEGTAWPSQTR